MRADQVKDEPGSLYPTPFSQKADEDAQRFSTSAAVTPPAPQAEAVAPVPDIPDAAAETPIDVPTDQLAPAPEIDGKLPADPAPELDHDVPLDLQDSISAEPDVLCNFNADGNRAGNLPSALVT